MCHVHAVDLTMSTHSVLHVRATEAPVKLVTLSQEACKLRAAASSLLIDRAHESGAARSVLQHAQQPM